MGIVLGGPWVPPVISSIPTLSFTEGESGSFDLSQYVTQHLPANAVDAATVYDLGALAGGLSISGASLVYDGFGGASSDSHILTVTDSAGQGSGSSFDISVIASGGLTASGVTGSIAPDGQVTIAWDAVNGFGADGPTLQVFEDFRDESDDTNVDTSATIGTWDAMTAHVPKGFASGARSQGMCGEMYTHDGTQRAARLAKTLTPTGTLFFTFAYKIPANTYWPYRATPPASYTTYPTGSSWKLTWPQAAAGDSPADGDPDLVVPTFNTDFDVVGNEGASMFSQDSFHPDTHHTFGSWARLAGWLRYVDNVNDDVWLQGVGPAGNIDQSWSASIFEALTPKTWGFFPFNPWAFENHADVRYQYDDLYLATGDGAAARVEIGDNATYSSCNDLAIATIDSWSDTSITCTLREGGFTSFVNKYIHIHDADNNYVGTSRLIS